MANHEHDFDKTSGWCKRCTYRDDGRLANLAGTVLRNGSHDYPAFDVAAHINELRKRREQQMQKRITQ